MVSSVELGEGDLLAGAEDQAEPTGFAAGIVGERNASYDEARGGEGCDLAIVGAKPVREI